MKSDSDFAGPTFMHGPGGQYKIFNKRADVPEGWTDNPLDHVDAPDSADDSKYGDLTREQVIAALNERRIAFKKNAPTKALYKQLLTVVEETEA